MITISIEVVGENGARSSRDVQLPSSPEKLERVKKLVDSFANHLERLNEPTGEIES